MVSGTVDVEPCRCWLTLCSRRTSCLIPDAIAEDPNPCAGAVGSGFHCTPLPRRTAWWSEVGLSADVCIKADREGKGSALGDRSGYIFAHMRPDLPSSVSDFKNEAEEIALSALLKDALALLGLNVSQTCAA